MFESVKAIRDQNTTKKLDMRPFIELRPYTVS